MDINGINGYAVWYRLEVAVHNYSYLIIQINNYNELPTCLMCNTGIHGIMYICRSVVLRRTSTGVAFLSYA